MARSLNGQVAWITGAGSGIGEAGAIALARAGAHVVLTGRREEPLQAVAKTIRDAGGKAALAAADTGVAEECEAAFAKVMAVAGRCDILVNSAGINVSNRAWTNIDAKGFSDVVDIDLKGPFYTSQLVMPAMRKQGGGLLIQVSSWAGRYTSRLTGPAYSAAKHALVSLSESINQEECGNGIRSCCICPGEVATPILAKRPVPVSDLDKSRMLQSEDLGDLILYVAQAPAHVCINEVLISPTWNRLYGPQ